MQVKTTKHRVLGGLHLDNSHQIDPPLRGRTTYSPDKCRWMSDIITWCSLYTARHMIKTIVTTVRFRTLYLPDHIVEHSELRDRFKHELTIAYEYKSNIDSLTLMIGSNRIINLQRLHPLNAVLEKILIMLSASVISHSYRGLYVGRQELPNLLHVGND